MIQHVRCVWYRVAAVGESSEGSDRAGLEDFLINEKRMWCVPFGGTGQGGEN